MWLGLVVFFLCVWEVFVGWVGGVDVVCGRVWVERVYVCGGG